MKIISEHFLNHGPDNPRNSEGSFVKLRDGRILLAYTRYSGKDWHDHCTADIASVISDDEGRTWQNGPVLLKNRALNVMSVSLLRLQDGRIAMVYLEKSDVLWQREHFVDCRPKIRFSEDGAAAWSEPADITKMQPVYLVMHNDRLLQTSGGRLICPVTMHVCTSRDGFLPGIGLFFYSDDGGKTWTAARNGCYPPEGLRGGLMEPGVIELAPAHLMAWFRTNGGCQYTAFSYDNAETWSHAQPAPEFPSPESPLSMKRDPVSGDLFAVWNNHHPQYAVKFDPEGSWGRTPLVLARSSDNGKSWKDHVVLEDAADHGFAYIAMFFDRSKLYLEYCCGSGLNGGAMLQDSKIRVLDIA